MTLRLRLTPKQLEKKELGFKKNFLKAAKIDDERVEKIVLVEPIDEKDGAGNFIQKRYYNLSFYRKYRANKEISTIVDVDEKNCLAQLTVVLKLNQSR